MTDTRSPNTDDAAAPDAVLTLLNAHRSIRRYDDRPIEQVTLESLIRCAQSAATSSNIQAVTYIDVQDAGTRAALREVAGGQSQVTDCARFLVACADLARPGRACQRAGGQFETGMTEHFIIATVDAALASQNLVVAAEALGLGICYIGALRNDPARVGSLLKLPPQVYPVFGLALGYPAEDPEVKPRLPVDAVLMTDHYDASRRDTHLDDYDETLAAYYAERSTNTRTSTWSQAMAGLVGKEARPHMLAYLHSQGFLQR